MPSRRSVLTLAVALVCLVSIPRLAMAQGAGAAEEPKPSAAAPGTPPATETPPAPPASGPAEAPPAPAEETVTAQPGKAPQKFGEEIVVTGSRIRRKDLTTPAPVTVLNREDLQASGKVTLGDFLQALPEQGNAPNSSVNNGGDGSTRVNLRGLGDPRTLVLVNGRRFVGTMQIPQFLETTVDLNSIPTAAIERIEILKDGASAVYGSDAVAGVINIITRKKFDGVEASGYSGITSHGDGAVYDVNAIAGTSGDRGSILFTAGFMKQNAIFAGDRPFSSSQLNLDFNTGQVSAGGSTNIPAGQFSLPGAIQDANGTITGCDPALLASGTQTYRNVCAAATGTTNQTWKFDPKAQLGFSPLGQDVYNFQPLNYDVTPLQRIQLFSTGDVSIASSSRAYYEASLVNRQSRQQVASMPLNPGFFVNPAEGAISASSIYNPLGVPIDSWGRRLLENGPRSYDQEIDTARIVLGVNGTLPESAGPLSGWFWDANMNYGRSWGTFVTHGALRTDKLAPAVGPSMIDPGTGQPICVSTPGDASTAIAGCSPLDIFHTAGAITPAQLAGLGFSGTTAAMLQMFDVQANFSGELFRLMADRPASLALGYEFRREYGQTVPDPIAGAGQSSDFNFNASGGGYYANEAYGELSVPIVNKIPYVENLEAVAAARFVDYNNFGTKLTYKAGLRYSPIADVTFRGTYSTAFRAPSVADLYFGLSQGSPFVVDPCSGINPVTLSAQPIDPRFAAACAAQGALNNHDTANQLTTHQGGNPKLQPETAKVFTVGAVYEPRWVKNLTATVDYWNYAIDSSITNRGAVAILNGCLTGTNPSFCDFIHRGSDGVITFIDDLQTNVGNDRVDGIDVALRYGLPTPVGRFGLIFDGTWLHKFDRILADGTVVHGKGTYDLATVGGGNFGVYPAWKFNTGVSYGIGGVSALLSTRFIGSFKECANISGQTPGGACYLNPLSRDVSAYTEWDLGLGYTFRSAAGRTALSAGVHNLFDAAPPLIYNSITPTSDPSAYDFVGRFLYVRLTQSI